MITLSTCSAILGTVLMLVTLILILPRYFAPLRAKYKPASASAHKVCWKDAFFWSAVWFICSRCLILFSAYIYARVTGAPFAPLDWCTEWDGAHYVGLIENWYVTEGDPRFHIVFFPVYPLLGRILKAATGMSALASALCVSNAAAIAAGAFLYMLCGGTDTSSRATAYFFLNPMSVFLSIAYSESVFLLLTIACVYYARKRKFVLALAIGAVCSASRLMGCAVAVPVFYEMMCEERERNTCSAGRICLRFASCFCILIGAGCYLLLNYSLTGNPFQFWIYQRDHWNNTSGTLWNTFSYIVRYAYLMDNVSMLRGTWIPTIVALYAALILLLVRQRKERGGDTAYAWIYMYVTIIPTWLISGPRYVSALYALYPMLAHCTRRKIPAVITGVLLSAGCVYMSLMFIFTYGVY